MAISIHKKKTNIKQINIKTELIKNVSTQSTQCSAMLLEPSSIVEGGMYGHTYKCTNRQGNYKKYKNYARALTFYEKLSTYKNFTKKV